MKFLVTNLYLWKWQYTYCFEAREGEPFDKGMFLLTKFEEVIQALGKEDPHNEVRHIPCLEELV